MTAIQILEKLGADAGFSNENIKEDELENIANIINLHPVFHAALSNSPAEEPDSEEPDREEPVPTK